MLDHFGPFWTILDHFGQYWNIGNSYSCSVLYYLFSMSHYPFSNIYFALSNFLFSFSIHNFSLLIFYISLSVLFCWKVYFPSGLFRTSTQSLRRLTAQWLAPADFLLRVLIVPHHPSIILLSSSVWSSRPAFGDGREKKVTKLSDK